MHISLLGIYWTPIAKGFYIGKIGDERFDSSLLGVHWSIDVYDEKYYSILSFDILYLNLLRNTLRSIFKKNKKEDEDSEE